jgi:hypothetical protein
MVVVAVAGIPRLVEAAAMLRLAEAVAAAGAVAVVMPLPMPRRLRAQLAPTEVAA